MKPLSDLAHITIVCGDRNWQAPVPIQRFLEGLPTGRAVVITGGAAGADTVAWNIAKRMGHRAVRVDAPWDSYGKRAGPVRNQWMLELLLMFKSAFPNAICDVHAFHANIASSRGTADMVTRARNNDIPYTIHSETEMPDV